MSYYDTAPAWQKWVDNGLDHMSRLGLLALIVVAWLATLAWPPPPSGTRPLVASQPGMATNPDYPLRITLPEVRPIAVEELVTLVEQNERLVAADVGLFERDDTEPGGSTGNGFAAAFAALIEPSGPRRSAATPTRQPMPDLKPGEMLAIDYDLATLTPRELQDDTVASSKPRFNAQDGSLTVSKPLLVDGQSRGSATIRIEQGAQIMIATASVADALGPRVETLPSRIANALATRTGFIPFNELRGAGIVVEYDPIKDRVSLSTAS